MKCLSFFAILGFSIVCSPAAFAAAADAAKTGDTDQVTLECSEWGMTSHRNNVPVGHNIPTDWKLGKFNLRTGEWDPTGSKNIKWVAKLGSQSYGNPVVADGKVFVGSNNSNGWLKRYPSNVDLGVLLASTSKTASSSGN